MELKRDTDDREESGTSTQVPTHPSKSGSEKPTSHLKKSTIQTEGGAYFAGPVTNQGGLNIFGGTIGDIHFKNTYENVFPRPVDPSIIEDAILKLSTLPLDISPIVDVLPPASRLPAFARNTSFVGREAELTRLATLLKARDLATAVITGLGGVGKSQLASEFVYHYGPYFAGGVFWLSFANADAVLAEVAECTIALGQELRLDVRTLPIDEQVHLVLSSWQNPLPRLLIFDNCEDESLLARWRPRIGGCRVLITSRREVWHPDLGVSVVPLDVLPRVKSVKLLGSYRFDLSVSDREQIAQELGDLPLALSLAGSYLHTYQESRLGAPQQYLFALRQVSPLEHASLQQEGNMYTTGHIEHVARTFALSYEQLDPEDRVDAAALQLLAHVAYFAPGEPISRDLLRRTMEPEKDDEQEDRFVKALKRVHALGLLNTQQEGAQQMHRLLVAFVQGHIASTATAKDAQASVEQAVRDFAWEVNDAGYPSPLLRVQEHLRVVAERANERGDAMAADLNRALGRHLQMIGAYQEALSYLQRALVICEQELGSTHPDTALSFNNLASLYQVQGKYTSKPSRSTSARWPSVSRSWDPPIPARLPPSTTWQNSTERRANTSKPSRSTSARWPSVNRSWDPPIPPRRSASTIWRTFIRYKASISKPSRSTSARWPSMSRSWDLPIPPRLTPSTIWPCSTMYRASISKPSRFTSARWPSMSRSWDLPIPPPKQCSRIMLV